MDGRRLSCGIDIFGVGAERQPRAGAAGMDEMGVGVVRRVDEVLDAEMDGRRLNDGIDVFGVGALRRERTDVDGFVVGVACFCIFRQVFRRMKVSVLV